MVDIRYKERKSALKAVKDLGRELQYVAPHLKDDRKVVLAAVKEGDFWTYYRPHSHEQPMNYFATSSWELRSMHLRNYDEGEPL